MNRVVLIYLADIADVNRARTSRTEGTFVKHLKSALKISGESDKGPGLTSKGPFCADVRPDILSNVTISVTVSELFDVHDYGLIPADFSASGSSLLKVPAGLQIRCWEAKEPERYLSAEHCAMLRARKEERERARLDCLRLLDGLNSMEKMDLLKGDKVEEKDKVLKKAIEVCMLFVNVS